MASGLSYQSSGRSPWRVLAGTNPTYPASSPGKWRLPLSSRSRRDSFSFAAHVFQDSLETNLRVPTRLVNYFLKLFVKFKDKIIWANALHRIFKVIAFSSSHTGGRSTRTRTQPESREIIYQMDIVNS